MLFSLVCTLTSAALAMLLQEWANRYCMVTRQSDFTPAKRARVRETFSHFASGRYILWGTYPMTLLIHLSIFFFLLGSLTYVVKINHAIFACLCLSSVFVPLHVTYYTAVSILNPGMLFYGPFSQLFLRISHGILYPVTRILSCIQPLRHLYEASETLYNDLGYCRQDFLKGKEKLIQRVVSNDTTKVDHDVLAWTFNYSVKDADLEKFFAAIPGFFNSKLVNNPKERLSKKFLDKFRRVLYEFLDHTFSSDTFSGLVRGDRLLICLNAARAALGQEAVSQILDDIRVIGGRWSAAFQSIEVGVALRRWNDTSESSHIRRIVARIISRVQVRDRDDCWIRLVKDEFGMPDRAFEDHITSGDSISLSILIHVTRQLLRTDSKLWEPGILRELSNFDIRATLPGQQHDLCVVWNEVVEEARRRGIGSTPMLLLEELRHVHTTLHQDTDGTQATYAGPTATSTSDVDILVEPFSYPLCRIFDQSIALPSPSHVLDAPSLPTSSGMRGDNPNPDPPMSADA